MIRHVRTLARAAGMRVIRNVAISMRDGLQLRANVYLPERGERWPTLMSVTPYGKDRLPDSLGMLFMRLSGVRFGSLDCSRWTGFESPDPVFWTGAGYSVVQADVRGMHASEGNAGFLTDADAEDYAELIQWAAGQLWSTGAVGLIGDARDWLKPSVSDTRFSRKDGEPSSTAHLSGRVPRSIEVRRQSEMERSRWIRPRTTRAR